MKRKELEQNIPPRYKVVSIRIHKTTPTVYVFVEDLEDDNKRKGLISKDGGKTYNLAWEKDAR